MTLATASRSLSRGQTVSLRVRLSRTAARRLRRLRRLRVTMRVTAVDRAGNRARRDFAVVLTR